MFEETSPNSEEAAGDAQAALLPSAPLARSDIAAVRVRSYAKAMAEQAPPDRLAWLRGEIEGPIIFTHGFGIEGQLIFHWICERALDIDVVTLDTGRLFPETYALWAETEQRYGRRIGAVYPNQTALESLVARQGIDGFYDSREAREACCAVRKTRPLDRALAGAAAWVTGARADQTAVRREAGLIGFDASRDILKFNPLYDWTRDAVLAVARENGVPINPLHVKGFASIGCAPCTRAIAPGEPERNGRWWWENQSSRECGLHLPRRTAQVNSFSTSPRLRGEVDPPKRSAGGSGEGSLQKSECA
jgi:phosphoadenosine phosphosulfate reductase